MTPPAALPSLINTCGSIKSYKGIVPQIPGRKFFWQIVVLAQDAIN